MRSNRTTIKEVAAAAGVSTQTVSRVVNNRPDVSDETRERIQKIIEDLDYRPSALARSLIQQRSYTLGVVTAGLKHIGPSRVLNGITQAAEKAGYSLILKELPHYHSNNIDPIFQELLARHVDGMLCAAPEIGDNHSWVDDLSIPLEIPLAFLSMKPRKNLMTVSIDNYQGGRLVMEHLYEKGYRRIGHVSGPLDWWEAWQRKAAWKDFLDERNLESEDECWAEGDWSSSSGGEAISRLLDQYPEMDAVFVANDQMALSVLRAAHLRGISIPDDLGVAGFDDIPEGAFFYPSLTTVHQDQFEVAKTAMQEMIQIVEGGWQRKEPPAPKSILISPTLVVRESTQRQP